RGRQVDFLRYLEPFDARPAWREAGYGSLWQFCLREGAAGRRIGAMRVLREFPGLEAPLRDGRLSLTTAVTLRPVLTRENLEEMVARAAFRTDEETRQLVVSLIPRPAPREEIRKLPETGPERAGSAETVEARPPDGRSAEAPPTEAPSVPPVNTLPCALALAARPASRTAMSPVSADQWSMRVSVDGAFREEIETLRCLLSHRIPDGNLGAVLREAVRCAIEKHGKRRGAVEPGRKRKPAGPKPRPLGRREPVPAEVRRAVWARDGGRCTYVSEDGRRCESRWQLELDHVESAAAGGPSTVENLRLRCRPHNLLHAETTFGREHMARFRRAGRPATRTGESTIAGDSGPTPVSGPAGAGG
ncbi:MAG TPA: HNH endonuclease, partial [Anaeromyxobacteraceae bacterium]|nr:HNH endonuclease [Anaeromyxobacteraceae bacterium]